MKKIIIITVILIVICCLGIEAYHIFSKKEVQDISELNNSIDKENIETEKIGATGGGESFWYEKALKYKINGKYGLMGEDKTIYTNAEYDNIEALNYEEGYIVLTKDSKSKVIKLTDNGYEEVTDYYDKIGILGADLEIEDGEEKYLEGNSTYIVGIIDGKRQSYIEISHDEEVENTNEVETDENEISNLLSEETAIIHYR